MYDFCVLFFMFFVYSVLGFLMELFFCSLEEKKIVFDRGFLIGPYCPIYGIAAVMISYVLTRYESDPWVVFCMGFVLSTILEYLASYLLEKIFKIRWWDYSHQAFNINGRVALRTSLLFGVASLVIVYWADSFYYYLVSLFDPKVFLILNGIFFLLFVVDVIVSSFLIFKLRRLSLLAKKDMTKQVKEEVKKELTKSFVLKRRVFHSFPLVFGGLRSIIEKIEKSRKK